MIFYSSIETILSSEIHDYVVSYNEFLVTLKLYHLTSTFCRQLTSLVTLEELPLEYLRARITQKFLPRATAMPKDREGNEKDGGLQKESEVRHTGKIAAPKDKYGARLGYVTAGCIRATLSTDPETRDYPLALLFLARFIRRRVSSSLSSRRTRDCKYVTSHELTAKVDTKNYPIPEIPPRNVLRFAPLANLSANVDLNVSARD